MVQCASFLLLFYFVVMLFSLSLLLTGFSSGLCGTHGLLTVVDSLFTQAQAQ